MCTSSTRHCCRWEAKFGRAGKWQTSSLRPRMDKRHPRARMSAMKFPSHFQQPSGVAASLRKTISNAAPSISHSIIRDWARDVFVCHLPQATPCRRAPPCDQAANHATDGRDREIPRFGSLCRATTRPPPDGASFSSGECRSGGHNMLQVDVVSGILLLTWRGRESEKPIFTVSVLLSSVQFVHSGTSCNCTL